MFASDFNKVFVSMFLPSHISKMETCVSQYCLHCIYCIHNVFTIITWIFFMKLIWNYDSTIFVSFIPFVCKSFFSLTKCLIISPYKRPSKFSELEIKILIPAEKAFKCISYFLGKRRVKFVS